ncbi:MAG: arginine transporter [Pseudomonadota bacterium]
MKRFWIVLVAALVSTSTPTFAREIEEACLRSDRENASPRLCQCIQKIADERLSPEDQVEAARFFDDPQLAQDTRQSDNPSKERFWERYTEWADRAARICS